MNKIKFRLKNTKNIKIYINNINTMYQLLLQLKINTLFISLIFLTYVCYSFTVGSVPDHLKTLQINNVSDNSGFGNPIFREEMARNLITKFRNDNSFSLVEGLGNARLTVAISSITDAPVSVQPGELEKERRVNVTTKAEYFDNVKKKVVWERSFDNFAIYDVSNVQENRNREIFRILEQTSNDILLAVVSGW